MPKLFTLIWLLLLPATLAYGQATCGNIGFENGSLSGWVLTNGQVADVGVQTFFQSEATGIFENGHLLTQTSDGNDPKITGEPIPMVPPGSNYAIRIGNVTRGSRFDRIKTSFVVTADNTLFQYQFAVILQNPNHQLHQQPGFSIKVSSQSGTIASCSFYEVKATGIITGFQAQGDMRYRNWTTGAVDLRNYIGQTVTVEVTANGCTERRHFGYAYFDAQCLKSEIKQDLFCPAYDQNMRLRAPEGFASYVWSNGATTPTISIKPKQGDRYWVKVKPFSSLNESCEYQLDHVINFDVPGEPPHQTVSICEGDGYTIGDSTYRKAGTYLSRIKRGPSVCDSLVRTTLTVKPLPRSAHNKTICEGESYTVGTAVYRATGTYDTRLSRTSPLCDSIVTVRLTVRKVDLILTEDQYVRPGDSIQLKAVALPTGTYQYNWLSPQGLSCPTCPVTWAKPDETTRYTLTATDTELNCQHTASVLIKVGICMVFTPNAFSPNDDGVNDVFYIIGSPCIRQIKDFVIYDRWGEVVFRRQNFPASEPGYGWNGTYLGLQSGAGSYPFRLEAEYENGRISRHQGSVLLIR
ncbi:hypothetical protein GCM10023189_03980 [Nibrella saemangeumensis]|uniref:Gliding motility-associated C-terminal domain-containing protein n=1 Tax=Nibrella saemangeumensis TaxID=1084526 RepID=A0ABP8MD39_9BACT